MAVFYYELINAPQLVVRILYKYWVSRSNNSLFQTMFCRHVMHN